MNDKTTYVTLEPIDADRRYAPGEPIALTWAQAKPLLDVRAIAEPSAEDGQAQQQAAALGSDLDDLARIGLLNSQLDLAQADLASERQALAELRVEHELCTQALQQARDDIQSLQTAKAEGASALAQLQAQHTEAVETKGQLAVEVAELQAKLAAASTASTKAAKK